MFGLQIDSDLIIKHERSVMINEIEMESESDFERNPLGQVQRLVQQHWKITG